jgi:acetylornithine deacetylase/succinyl-diaminopimelate desuccinylase-like protein
MRSGKPYDASWVPGKAALYVDVRLPPGERPEFVRGDIEAVLADAGVDETDEP